MIQSERRQKIYELVQKNGYITYDKISAEMGVTDRTIRRDVNELSEQGLLCKVWGGVKSVDSKISLESDFQIRTEQNSLIKQKIGEKAASLIEEGECIGIDIGTTALEVAKSLNSKDVTVVTSSIPAIIELMNKPEINVICTGGKLSRNDKCFNGQYATTVLDEIILDKDLTNKIDGETLFFETSNLSRMFRFSMKFGCLVITLDTIKLDKHFVYYLLDFLNILKKSIKKENSNE